MEIILSLQPIQDGQLSVTIRPLVKSAYRKINFLMGTQKNCPNETVRLSTQNIS